MGTPCACPGGRGNRRRRHRHDGLLSMTATPRLTLRRCTVARCCWTGRRAVSTSSTRSTAVATTSALPSTSAPRCAWSSTDPAQPWAGRWHPYAGAARLELPPSLEWTLHRGETDPILGWYSGGLGQRIPAFTLIGCGRSAPGVPLITRLEFFDIAKAEPPAVLRSAVSRHFSDVLLGEASAI